MALTEVIISDMALGRLGVSRPLEGDVDGTLANCTDASLEKTALERWFPRCRNAVLEAHPWTFARKYATLVLADDGTGEIWTDEWANAYTYPADALKIRRFVTDVGGGPYGLGTLAQQHYPRVGDLAGEWPFVIRIHDGAKVILTDVAAADADVEYTYAVTDAALFTEQFASMLAWSLAKEVGPAIDADPRRAQMAAQMFYMELRAAAASISSEENNHGDADGEFIRSRMGTP